MYKKENKRKQFRYQPDSMIVVVHGEEQKPVTTGIAIDFSLSGLSFIGEKKLERKEIFFATLKWRRFFVEGIPFSVTNRIRCGNTYRFGCLFQENRITEEQIKTMEKIEWECITSGCFKIGK